MSNVIDIKSYLESCDNCKWHSRDGSGACLRPGGWHPKRNYWDCADFQRKTGRQKRTKGENA